jgi:hypothetical protein
MKTVEPVEMQLPSHPRVLPRRDLGAPQTSNHDVGATRGTSLRRRLRLEGNEYDLIFKVYLRTALQQQY